MNTNDRLNPDGSFCFAGLEDELYLKFDDHGYATERTGIVDPSCPLYLFDNNTKIARPIPAQYQNTPLCLYPFCGGYSEGRIMVSTMGEIHLQYHHKFFPCAGMWGWLDVDFNQIIPPQYVYAMNFMDGKAIVCKGDWNVKKKGGQKEYWCENEAWGVIDRSGGVVVPCRFDELYVIDGTEDLYAVHEGGWDHGHCAVYSVHEQQVILALDFSVDLGYMFNECFVTDQGILVFLDHQPGEGVDVIYAYDLARKEYLAYQEEIQTRTIDGEDRVVVNKDGSEIIVF